MAPDGDVGQSRAQDKHKSTHSAKPRTGRQVAGARRDLVKRYPSVSLASQGEASRCFHPTSPCSAVLGHPTQLQARVNAGSCRTSWHPSVSRDVAAAPLRALCLCKIFPVVCSHSACCGHVAVPVKSQQQVSFSDPHVTSHWLLLWTRGMAQGAGPRASSWGWLCCP